jgi:Domain of unknown function (DUF4387)
MATLGELAKLVRSKNAGPFWLTIDIMFNDRDGPCCTDRLTP